ncbi:MAG: hypothetical protein HY646_09590 [Acidobacteria bacterium]|nr:hypothetical protein [Acidobacteriota bacterium]
MIQKLFIVIALTFALAPTTLGQQAQAQAQTQATATAEARIDSAMEAAARANIPVSLLKSKVAEGEAKRVPKERIASAVEARLSALMRASGALRRAEIEAKSEGELALIADAMDAGVAENVVVRCVRSAPAERRVVAVAVLADLVRLGHASETAFVRVNAALNTNAALANLHAEVASQLRVNGLKPTLDATGALRILK